MHFFATPFVFEFLDFFIKSPFLSNLFFSELCSWIHQSITLFTILAVVCKLEVVGNFMKYTSTTTSDCIGELKSPLIII